MKDEHLICLKMYGDYLKSFFKYFLNLTVDKICITISMDKVHHKVHYYKKINFHKQLQLFLQRNEKKVLQNLLLLNIHNSKPWNFECKNLFFNVLQKMG